MLIVAALGGNAVSPPGLEGNIPQQFASTRAAIRPLADLLIAGHQVVITHGNGPQVGNVMRRVEIAARHQIYPLPLDIVVADTQAGMGYMICQCLTNELAARGDRRICTAVITTVRVESDDPAFRNPTKPVGPFLARDEAERHRTQEGWSVVEDSGRGWRRVVASPEPLAIIELASIRHLVDAGQVVVAAGGGGIPIVKDHDGRVRGVEAVIDKDRTSALLATGLNADLLVILTGVDQVQRDFGSPNATAIEHLTVAQARDLLASGQFPAGSMGPKIDAAIWFLDQSRRESPQVLITSCDRLPDAVAGHGGTRITR